MYAYVYETVQELLENAVSVAFPLHTVYYNISVVLLYHAIVFMQKQNELCTIAHCSSVCCGT